MDGRPDFWMIPKASATKAVTHVLDAVLGGVCYYVLGTYNDTIVRFSPAANTSVSMGHKSQRFDFDPHYSACRTFQDFKTGRQILTADVYEERSGADSHGGAWGWSTTQAIPRSLVLEESVIGPRLRTEPIAELASLRSADSHVVASGTPFILQPNTSHTVAGLSGQSLEVILTLAMPPMNTSKKRYACGLRVLSSGGEYVEVGLSSNNAVPGGGGFQRMMNNTDFGGMMMV